MSYAFPLVQKFCKSVKIWQGYREFKGGNFFETQCSTKNPRHLPQQPRLRPRPQPPSPSYILQGLTSLLTGSVVKLILRAICSSVFFLRVKWTSRDIHCVSRVICYSSTRRIAKRLWSKLLRMLRPPFRKYPLCQLRPVICLRASGAWKWAHNWICFICFLSVYLLLTSILLSRHAFVVFS